MPCFDGEHERVYAWASRRRKEISLREIFSKPGTFFGNGGFKP
jgi:hypothetical protein